MKGPGILWMLQTVVGISMSGPIFVIAVGYLRTGRFVGGIGFLVLGAATFYFPTYLINQIGGPRTWLRRWIGRLGGDDTDDESEDDSGSDPQRSSIRDRLQQ